MLFLKRKKNVILDQNKGGCKTKMEPDEEPEDELTFRLNRMKTPVNDWLLMEQNPSPIEISITAEDSEKVAQVKAYGPIWFERYKIARFGKTSKHVSAVCFGVFVLTVIWYAAL
jgi:hypothetical protein